VTQKLTVSFTDAHQENSDTNFYVNNAGDAQTAVAHLHGLSNARINGAYVSSPMDISALTGNGAVEANIETVATRMVARYSAPTQQAGIEQDVLLKIPAPVGSVINGTFSIADQAPLQALVGVLTAADGTATNGFHEVYYEK
jgi:hypothetical protein